ncbi:hypothetical protein VHEMI01295 [[Torrubiella] hemipterigena]|uniref:Peptidase S53 domain-containing protein n=1 Tax=[Torrubiella] hemipterigena TaxID=1531966 RepID=A0A0A1T527_9HYPO|nr:hypothetical protein VHEMI01295 [[Torrubiella] hemipterigena]
MKLGLRGTSVFHATADSGVKGPLFQNCKGTDKSIFNALTTASCPYVTAVGGTELPTGKTAGDAEQVASLRFSGGGGFSNVFPRPAYQDAAVSSFLKDHAPAFSSYNQTDGTFPADGSGGVFNRGGRAYPDISAVSSESLIVFNGKSHRTGGTSMSTPIVAAIFNLINENRLAAGRKPVGFVNPALYQNPAMFNDITLGGMRKDKEYACKGNSFDATPGWDAATGMGTPNYPEMSKYFMSL